MIATHFFSSVMHYYLVLSGYKWMWSLLTTNKLEQVREDKVINRIIYWLLQRLWILASLVHRQKMVCSQQILKKGTNRNWNHVELFCLLVCFCSSSASASSSSSSCFFIFFILYKHRNPVIQYLASNQEIRGKRWKEL